MSRVTLNRLLVVIGLAGFVLLFQLAPVDVWLERLTRLNQAHPVAVPLTYVAFVCLATVALVPGWISMMVAGMLFGLIPGLPYALAGITAGAFGAFIAGRVLGRSWVEQRMGDSLKLQALDEAVDAQSFYIVFLTRFSIVLPFNVLNYAFGLTRVSATTYVAATALGMLLPVALYVYLGTLADDLGQILAGELRPSVDAYWIVAIALAAIALLVWVLHRTARRAISRSRVP